MYITADGDDEVVMATNHRYSKGIGAGLDRRLPGTPRSIESVDVKKADRLITATPDGRMRLLTFLNKIEKKMASEKSGRRADIAAIRAHMARNMAYNQAARSAMKKQLLAKMAVNAKRAKAALDKNMRRTQRQFAAAAALENRRNAATMARSAATRRIMRRNKRQAAQALKLAVLTQQRNLAALAQVTNAKIKRTNKHIAANAAHIAANAKAARKALNKAMNAFDHKMNNIASDALKKRSKLVAQANAQNAKFRSYANNRIRAIVASTAAKFKSVRDKMAKDRMHADNALLKETTRLSAALKANKALQDKRFRKTVANIKAAKAEANKRVAAAKRSFKVRIAALSSTVKTQVAKLNGRVTSLSGTITRNKLEQAKVNRNTNAEIKRMISLGNKRYQEHIAKDKELSALMNKNKASTLRRMKRLSDSFTLRMKNIHKQMAKDRRHSANKLKSATNKLYATLKANAARQSRANKAMAQNTASARREARDSLKKATMSFTARLAKMHAISIRSARKQQRKINKLTGIVTANAVKDAKGRAELHQMRKANKLEIKGAISRAIAAGENHARRIERNMRRSAKRTRKSLNGQISTQISKVRQQVQRSLYKLSLENKAERKQLKAVILGAVADAAKAAKKALKKNVNWTTAKFLKLEARLASEGKKGSKGRAALRRSVAAAKKSALRNLKGAVENQNRALLAEKAESNRRIKKANLKLTSYARQMEKDASAVKVQMKSNIKTLNSKLSAAKRAAKRGLAATNAASLRRYNSAINLVKKSIAAAKKSANRRFALAYKVMARDRKAMDRKLRSSVVMLNNKKAELASLQDVRFKKVQKNIKKLKADTRAAVRFAKKNFTTKLMALTTMVKDQETRLKGEIAVVTGNIKGTRRDQLDVNKKVSREINNIVATANQRASGSKRARGKLRAILNANKKTAAAEVAALAKSSTLAIALLRSKQAAIRRKAAKNLTRATKALTKRMDAAKAKQARAQRGLRAALKGNMAASKGALKAAKASFRAKVLTMTNLMTMNQKRYEAGLKRVTGVVHSYKKSSKRDLILLKEQTNAMNRDLSGKLAKAISRGMAKAKKAEATALSNIKKSKKALSTFSASMIERMANGVYKTIQGGRHKVADNYLSLKAYAATGKDAITDYMKKSKRSGLSSIGDLLVTVGRLSKVKVKKSEGVGAGAKTLPAIFGGKKMKMKNAVSSINFLVNEYTRTLTSVQQRWPMGLGKYLLAKVESNMQKSGILEVDRLPGKSKNFVFVNAQQVGLSSKLSDFAGLAVKMTAYQATLTGMASKVAKKAKASKRVFMKAPEWQGN
jgi:hypothetical protein